MKFQPSTEFPYISKEQWLEHLAASLKTGTLRELYPEIDGRLYNPFVHREDVLGNELPDFFSTSGPLIVGLSYDAIGVGHLHQALQHGVQSLCLSYEELTAIRDALYTFSEELPQPFIIDLKGIRSDRLEAVNELLRQLPVVVHANIRPDSASALDILPAGASTVYPYTYVLDCRRRAVEALAEFLYHLTQWSTTVVSEEGFPIVIEIIPHVHVLYQIALNRAMRWVIAQWRCDAKRAFRLEWKAFIPAMTEDDPHVQLIELSWRVFSVAVSGVTHITAVPKTSDLNFHLAAAHIAHLLYYESKIFDCFDVGMEDVFG